MRVGMSFVLGPAGLRVQVEIIPILLGKGTGIKVAMYVHLNTLAGIMSLMILDTMRMKRSCLGEWLMGCKSFTLMVRTFSISLPFRSR